MIISTNSKWQPAWIYDRHDFSYFWSTSHTNASYQVSSTGLSVQEKRRKIDFQDGRHGGHLGYPIGKILAIFDLQVTPMSPTKFGVSWPFGAGEEAKYRFSRWPPWRPSWISDRHDFSYFWSISQPNASYQGRSQLAFGLGVEAKNRFSRWQPWQPSWISNRHDFSYFWSTSHPDAS